MIRGRFGPSLSTLPVALFLSGFFVSLGAQEVQGTLSLDQALELARRNSPTFRQTANNQGPADWAFRESVGQFLPSFNTSVTGQYIEPGVPSTGLFDASDFGLGSTDYYFSYYNLTLNYSIGGSTFFDVASSRANQNATRAEIRAAEYTLESNVTAQYIIALRARDAVLVAQRELDRAHENYELAQARVEVGAVIPTDGKQAEVERGRARVTLIEAESTYRTERHRLLEQVGVEADGEFELTSDFSLFEPTWDRDELLDRALTRHPQLRATRARESAGNANVRSMWSQYLPTLRFQANWSGRAREIGDTDYLLGQTASSFQGARANCEFMNELSDKLTQPLEGYPADCAADRYIFSAADSAAVLANNDVFPFNWRKEPLSVYMQISFPVFSGFQRERQVAEAKAAADDARFNRRAEELRIQTEVTSAYDELMAATQVVEIEIRNREVAEEQLALAQERYSLGAAAFLELLEAQQSMAAAERDYLNARYRFHGAIWRLEAAVGERLRPDAENLP